MLRHPEIKELEYIRTLHDKSDDYRGVAECYNSFKDSDSWPGGFGGSQIFTMESVKEHYENKDLENFFVALAPEDKKKIVGVCILNRSWIIPDAWYVALLGVMPSYQGKKLGKALLLAATKLCTEKKVRFLSLHTWEGNLKAMPLYKRQGYKWRPKTSVYMENYIPQILNFPLFKAFFEEYCWYDVFKPIINQAMDDEKQDGMLIYEYYFKADDENFIKVWIDRTIGKITGFHFKHKEKELIIRNITKAEAFIGIEEFTINLSVENRSKEPIKLNYKVWSSQDIKLMKGEIKELLINPNETKDIEFTAVLTSQAEEIDLDREPDKYSKAEINFEIEYQGISFQLTVGKLPKRLVDVYTFPFNYPWIKEKGKHTIPLTIENKYQKELEIEVQLIDGKSIKFENKTIKAKISPYDTTVYLDANILEIPNSIDKFSIKILHDKRTLLKKTMNVVLSQIGKAYVYETKEHIFIENELLRVRLFKKSSPLQNSIQISDKTGELPVAITGYAPVLGIPFDDEGSEFFSMDLKHEIIETEQGIILKSSAISEIKKGIKLTRYLLLLNIGDMWHVWFEVENTTENLVKDIGVLITLWGWDAGRLVNEVYFPFLEGIKTMNIYEIRPYLGTNPKTLKEGWIAATFKNKTLGTIFEPKAMDKIVIKAFPEIEYMFGNLKSHQKKTTPHVHYTLTKDWQTVQKRWRELKSQTVIEQMCTKALSTDLIKIGLVSKILKEPSLALLVENNKQVKMEINAFKEAGIKGKIKIELDCLERKPTEFEIPLTKSSNWQEKLDIDNSFEGLAHGILTFDTYARIYEYPIAVGVYNKNQGIKIERLDGYYKVSNGSITFKASEKIGGRIFEITTAKEGKERNYLISNFPKAKPFMWWARFYGGLGVVLTKGIWSSEDLYASQKFEPYETSFGDWKGIAFKSPILTHNPYLKGVQVTTSFLLLPSLPIILVKIDLKNHSGSVKRVSVVNHAFLATSETSADEYFVPFEGKVVQYHLNDEENRIYTSADTKWMSYKNAQRDKFFAIAYPKRMNLSGYLNPSSINLQHFDMSVIDENIMLKPNEIKSYYIIYALLEDMHAIEPFVDFKLV